MKKLKTKMDDNELPYALGCEVMPKKKWQGLSYFSKRKLKRQADKAFLVKFFFSNGTCKEFVIVGKTETFTYRRRTYHLRYENSWFNLTQNQFELMYFDDYPEPIDREIVKQGDEKFFSVTPDNIKPLLKMEYVKALASSEELIGRIKNIFVIVIILACLLGINLLLTLGVRGIVRKLAGI